MAKICKIADQCGGCHWRHLDQITYERQKIADFSRHFEPFNLSDEIYDAPIFIPEQTRRRTSISFFYDGQDYVWGYKQARSHKIIAPAYCHNVTPEIADIMAPLACLMRPLVKKNIQVKAYITHAHNGLDVHIRGIKAPNTKALQHFHEKITKECPKIIRLTIDFKLIFQTYQPLIAIKDHLLPLPIDSFLQASEAGQNALIDKMLEYMGKISKKSLILDLFCGLGTFTLPLLSKAHIIGYDNAGSAIQILGGYTQTHKRDLFRDPLSFMELNKADYALIDPPRAGGMAQIQQISKSKLKKLIYIFCNPQSAARDMQILYEAGWKLKKMTAIDQFTYSTHIEGIALLDHPR